MPNFKEPREKTDQARRPVASASIRALFDGATLEPEIAHEMISGIAVALLSHVAEEMRSLSINVPACAEPLSPTLRMIEEVSQELDSYRAILEQC